MRPEASARRAPEPAAVTRTAHLAESGWGQAACAGDYDNDGKTGGGIDNLEAQRRSLALATQLLEQNRIKAKAGVLPA